MQHAARSDLEKNAASTSTEDYVGRKAGRSFAAAAVLKQRCASIYAGSASVYADSASFFGGSAAIYGCAR
eukprot:1163395-Rhodomonas_salina.2